VDVAVEARGATPEAARERAAAAMTSVMSALRKTLPNDAIRTASFSIQPEMEYPDNKPQVRGYVARNQVEARVAKLDKLADVMDASVSSGATTISGLRFDLEKRDEAEREALRLAVEDAMARAEAIAKGAHRDLGGVVRISEQRMSAGPRMFAMPAPMMAERAKTPTPIAAADIEIQAQVTLTVAIK
jgi:uncharacterized protein YggE